MKIRYVLWALVGIILLMAFQMLDRQLGEEISAGKRAATATLFAMSTLSAGYCAVQFGLRRLYRSAQTPLPQQMAMGMLLFHAIAMTAFLVGAQPPEHKTLGLLFMTSFGCFAATGIFSVIAASILKKKTLETPLQRQLSSLFGGVSLLDGRETTSALGKMRFEHASIHPNIMLELGSFWEREGYVLHGVPWESLDIPRIIVGYCTFLALLGEDIQRDETGENPILHGATQFVTRNEGTGDATLHQLCFSTKEDGVCTLLIISTRPVKILGARTGPLAKVG